MSPKGLDSREEPPRTVEDVMKLFFNECSRLQAENSFRLKEMQRQIDSQTVYIRQLEEEVRKMTEGSLSDSLRQAQEK